MEAITEEKEVTPLANLRAKLSQKAKLEPKFRFYTLYHHLTRDDVLQEAWKKTKRNGGAAGIDGVTIKAIENSPEGVQGFLAQIKHELRSKTYHPKPVKRVFIPKSDGKLRPLGIPTLKDRVVQTAMLLIIEPIFEQDFLDCSYGFRPGKSAHQAVNLIAHAIRRERLQIYDADLKGYFDSIPHDKLMKALEMRITDRQILKLIRKWLEAPIWEPGKPMKSNDQGTPQGGIISPLLANLYLHWFDKMFHSQEGPGTIAGAILVRYADDFVVMARYLTGKMQRWIENWIEVRSGLTINKEKTKIVNLATPGSSLDFLGFTLRRVALKERVGKFYCQITPSKKSVKKARERIKEETNYRIGFRPIPEIVTTLNKFLSGWGRYFVIGQPSKAYSSVNGYVQEKLYRFVQRRSQKGYKRKGGCDTWYKEFQRLGLILLTKQRFQANAQGRSI